MKYIVPDFILYVFRTKPKQEESKIVFVGTVMHGRIGRIAKWLKKTDNRKIILICSKSGYASKLSNDFFDETILFRNKWHLKRLLNLFDNRLSVFHLFGPPYLAAYEGVRDVKLGKKIFDFQDLMITNFGLNPPFKYMRNEIEREKFVLSNVDGIVAHSLELQCAKKYYKNLCKKVLCFPNFVDNEVFRDNVLEHNEELNLVYVGSIMPSFRDKNYFGGMQLRWLIEKLNAQKIHFHIYPSPTLNMGHLEEYVELDKKLDYFHLHLSVSQKELSGALVKFDFGVLPFFHRTNKRLNDKRHYSTTLKLFNFFESGLPVIISEDLGFQNFIASKFGGGIKFSWEDFDNVHDRLKDIDYELLMKNILMKREVYSLKKKINILTTFYKEI